MWESMLDPFKLLKLILGFRFVEIDFARIVSRVVLNWIESISMIVKLEEFKRIVKLHAWFGFGWNRDLGFLGVHGPQETLE